MNAPSVTRQLHQLREQYIAKVNAAVDEGRESRAHELADRYADEALALLTSTG